MSVEVDQEKVAELTALVRKVRQLFEVLERNRADALVELRLVAEQALDAGANWGLIQELSGLDLSEFQVERFRSTGPL